MEKVWVPLEARVRGVFTSWPAWPRVGCSPLTSDTGSSQKLSCPFTDYFQYFSNNLLFLGTGQGSLLGTPDAGSKALIHHHVSSTPGEHQARATQFNNVIIVSSKSTPWYSASSFWCFWINISEISVLQSISRNWLSDPIWNEHKFHNTGSFPHGGNPDFSPALNNGCLLLFETWNN